MVDSLCSEIDMRLKYYAINEVRTLYFGGGTPSLLQADDWLKLVETFQKYFIIEELKEFTIEANPDDINNENLNIWRQIGVNRLSIGVQSFRNEDLVWMNRAHVALDSLNCIELAQNQGFTNISIDLMYGLPNQNLENWIAQLYQAGRLKVPHVSAYCLTVEERTALKKRVDLGDLVIPDDELVEQQFNALVDVLASFGLEQYEISNFALKGCEAIHNSNYWLGASYLAIGPSAHGYDGTCRYWNISNNREYIKAISSGKLPQTTEHLSPKDQFNELILTGLRTKWGVDLNELEKIHAFSDSFVAQLNAYLVSGIVEHNGHKIRLMPSAKIKADYYASQLFLD